MKFDDLQNWLEAEIEEDDIIEIAGTGEPTLCEWLPDLLCYLEQKKAWVMLRTNGFGLGTWRLALNNLLVIISKHDSDEKYLSDKCKFLFPHDLILSIYSDDIWEKGKVGKLPDNPIIRYKSHNVNRAFFITPDGKVRFMPCTTYDMGTVWDYKASQWDCVGFSECTFILGAYNFIEYLKSPYDLPSGFNHVQVKNFMEEQKWI